MKKPIFKATTNPSGEFLFLWTNPPTPETGFTYQQLLELSADLTAEAFRSAMEGQA